MSSPIELYNLRHNWSWALARISFVRKPPRFEICILSQRCCELRSKEAGWSRDFLSVKGALDFLGGMEGVEVTFTEGTGTRAMKLILPDEGVAAGPSGERSAVWLASARRTE